MATDYDLISTVGRMNRSLTRQNEEKEHWHGAREGKALRAITADAAWQVIEENRKGKLEVGKLADLVLLSADPLAVDPISIRDIKVRETIKEGTTVFSAKG